MPTLEERIAKLEKIRYSQLAQLNALRTLAIGAWVEIAKTQPDPRAFAKEVAEAWLRGAEPSGRDLRLLDAAEIEHLSQAYEGAIRGLGSELRRALGLPK